MTYTPEGGADAVTKKLGSGGRLINVGTFNPLNPSTFNIKNYSENWQKLTNSDFLIKWTFASLLPVGGSEGSHLNLVPSYNASTGVLSIIISAKSTSNGNPSVVFSNTFIPVYLLDGVNFA